MDKLSELELSRSKCFFSDKTLSGPLASPLQPRCDISTIPLEDTMREHCIDSDWLALSLHPANVFRFTYQWKTLPGLCESNFVGTAGEQIASVNILNILS